MEKTFRGKTVLVTGGTGSIGSELVRQILKYDPEHVRVYSRDENKQHDLREELGHPSNVNFLIGEVRDKKRLTFAMKGVNIVLHAAAMKHVPLCEYNPFEAVKTNILGSQNVIDAAIKHEVDRVIGISTDKAVHPSGVLGTSKLMMEKLFVNANNYTKPEHTKFSSVRFGNIIWSRGSVLPTWRESLQNGDIIRLTDNKATRFFMSKEEAIHLVLRATQLTQGGELFTFKMPSIHIEYLAKLYIEKYHNDINVKINIVGQLGGEKVHEELFSFSDLSKQVFTDDELFIIVPHIKLFGLADTSQENVYYHGFSKIEPDNTMSSEHAIDIERIKKMI